MAILAFDTSSFQLTLALELESGERFVRQQLDLGGQMAEGILGEIDSLLKEASIELSHIKKIGVGTGPGSFTGLRIGISTAQGLSFATGAELVGVPTMLALTPSEKSNDSIAVEIDVGRQQIALALVQNNSFRENAATIDIAAREATLSGWDSPEVISATSKSCAIDTNVMLELTKSGEWPAKPQYARPSDAKLPNKPLRIFAI